MIFRNLKYFVSDTKMLFVRCDGKFKIYEENEVILFILADMTSSRTDIAIVHLDLIIYYIKLQFSLSVCLYPPFFSTRPSDRNQIWHTFG